MNKWVKIGLPLLLVVAAVGWMAAGGRAVGVPARSIAAADTAGTVYTLTDGFTTDRINNRLWVSHAGPRMAFALRPDATPAQVAAMVRRVFRPNPYPEAVLHGNSARVPVGWAYIELRNATPRPLPLVLSMPQYRCNQATLYVGQSGPGPGRDDGPGEPHERRFVAVGTLLNTTPLGGRFFPFLEYAFPLTLPPGAVVPLLLRTESHVGFHEVDVRLSTQPTFVETAFTGSIRDGLQVLVCILLALVAVVVGARAANRLLLTYGGYLLSLALAFSCQFGYLNFWAYPDWLSVNAATVGTLGRLLINITFHPFFYAVIRPALRNRRDYKRVVIAICAVNAGFMGLHLLPFRYYGQVNYGINIGMVSLTVVNLGWLVYYAVLAWRRARIWSMLMVCFVALAPALLSQLLSLIQVAGGQDSLRQPALHPLFIILALSYLTIEQFRKELVTRRKLWAQVRQAQEAVNGLRRREIESIGRDLHDQVGNTLATALGYLSRMAADTEKPRAIIVGAIRELRFLSHNLVKDDDRPLTDKVETLVGRINDFASIRMSVADYTHKQIDGLPDLKQQNLYSIIQELLTNIIRHSGATQASVQFFCDGTTVDVSVEDDGVGFDLATARANGIGIQNIYKRAALSAIEVRFDAAPTGTSIQLTTLLHDTDPHPAD